MIFTTWLFAAFLILAAAGAWVLPVRARVWWLVVVGLVFYGTAHPGEALPLAAAAGGVFVLGQLAGRTAGTMRAGIVATGVAGTLAWLVHSRWTHAAPGPFAPLSPFVTPLATSFLALELVHYLVEVGRGRSAPGRLRDVAFFVACLPTLVCGPVKRFDSFAGQLAAAPRFAAADVGSGLERIVRGLAKKLLVADLLGRITDVVWAAPELFGPLELWMGAYAYAAQIVFEFSGFTDIAVGTGRLLGLRLPENFAAPYRQPNLARFWDAWHVSLTRWLDDYVAAPIRGAHPGPVRAWAGTAAAMTLSGLWHGNGLHFVAWGLYHAAGLGGLRLYQALRGTAPRFGRAGRIVATIATFHFVCVGWIVFRFDLPNAAALVARMVGAIP